MLPTPIDAHTCTLVQRFSANVSAARRERLVSMLQLQDCMQVKLAGLEARMHHCFRETSRSLLGYNILVATSFSSTTNWLRRRCIRLTSLSRPAGKATGLWSCLCTFISLELFRLSKLSNRCRPEPTATNLFIVAWAQGRTLLPDEHLCRLFASTTSTI